MDRGSGGGERVGAGDHNHIMRTAPQHRRQLRRPLGMSVGVVIFDQQVVVFGPAQVPHAAAEAVDIRMRYHREPGDPGTPHLLGAPAGGRSSEEAAAPPSNAMNSRGFH